MFFGIAYNCLICNKVTDNVYNFKQTNKGQSQWFPGWEDSDFLASELIQNDQIQSIIDLTDSIVGG